MPLDYWRTVLVKTNAKAEQIKSRHPESFVGGRKFDKPFSLEELMKFFGLLIMMSVVRGGEYTIYWSNPSVASFLMPGMLCLLFII